MTESVTFGEKLRELSNLQKRALLPAVVLGGITFLATCGMRVLDVTRVRWLLVGDTATYFLAWEYFRKTPFLQWPLGSNPEYGAGLNSSIFLSDGLPLVSLVLKPLAWWIDGDFQFFGWWLLLCFVLQAFFSLKILEQLAVPFAARLAVAPLFLLQPAFLDRMSFDGYGHMALSAQWLILAAIWLWGRPTTSPGEWLLLALGSAGINMYLFIVVLAMLAVWLAERTISSQQRLTSAVENALRLVVTVALAFALVYALGGLQGGSASDTGFGIYRSTLSSLLDSSSHVGQTWSRFITFFDLGEPSGAQEGFGFLGSGVILLGPIALLQLARHYKNFAKYRFLIWGGVAAFFLVLSVSPNIALGARELVSYPVPDRIHWVLSIFRASGRFIWVPMYLVILSVVGLVSNALRYRRRLLVAVLLAASGFQLLDSATALRETRERFTEVPPPLVTESLLWESLAKNRTHLVSIPPLNNDPRWIDLAWFAEKHGMSTTAFYFSRTDQVIFDDLKATSQLALERREFQINTVYVITNYPPNPETPKLFAEQRAGLLPGVRVIQQKELTVIVRD